MSHTIPYVWVDSPTTLAEMSAHLRNTPVISVDTESNSLYVYFEKVCLLQFSTRDTDYLVDPFQVDVGSLGDVFASRDIEKVFHAAEYDILSLKRDYGFAFEHLFDTMIAARVLGWRRYGLGSILEERFNVRLNKKMQRYNWGTRPLSKVALDYARLDTHYLLALRDLQLQDLKNRKRLVEARQAFQRQAQVDPPHKSFDPNNFWRIRGVRDLEPRQQAVLRQVFIFRDGVARQLDLPPFRVMDDATLVRLARFAPTDAQTLSQVKGVSRRISTKCGHNLLKAIQRGLQAPPPTYPHNSNNRLSRAVSARYETLREWRKVTAEMRSVEPDVVLPNRTLMELAKRHPSTPEALARIDSLDDWQRKTYGDELLAVLRNASA